MSSFEATLGAYTISTDPKQLDARAIHAYITQSYWATGRSYETVVRTLERSLCFGLYDEDTQQVGLARVVTDYTILAHLCDVYVLDEHQGQGLGSRLIESALAHPELQTVRRWTLVTSDAHEFYTRFGFVRYAEPDKHMELVRLPAA